MLYSTVDPQQPNNGNAARTSVNQQPENRHAAGMSLDPAIRAASKSLTSASIAATPAEVACKMELLDSLLQCQMQLIQHCQLEIKCIAKTWWSSRAEPARAQGIDAL
jgi:hypothetical protein